MDTFLSIFGLILTWMKETTIISFTLGGQEFNITALALLVSTTAVCIAIDVVHNIFDY